MSPTPTKPTTGRSAIARPSLPPAPFAAWGRAARRGRSIDTRSPFSYDSAQPIGKAQMNPDILQIAPMQASVTDALHAAYTVHRWWDAPDQAALLADDRPPPPRRRHRRPLRHPAPGPRRRPEPRDRRLLRAGSATTKTRDAMGALVLRNLAAHFAGEPLPSAVA